LLGLSPALQGPMSDLAKPQDGRSMRATSTFREGRDGKYDSRAWPKGDLEEKSNWDNFRVLPGQTHVLMDVKGPGVITHMWITFLGPEIQNWAPKGSANHQDMLLRIYWDGNPKPGVEAPVGDFFANCFGRRDPVVSLPVVVDDGDSYNCFWNMPFHKSARVEIVNQSDKSINLLYYNIDWIKKDSLPKDTPYFYAQYRQEYPVQHGKDYLILDTKGKGHYVGTVLAVRTRSPEWFGEGDEKIYIDGEEHESIHGTGTEDYFLAAWGLKKTMSPYFGVPYFDQWGIVGGHTSAFRWHINDPIVFEKGIRVTIEHFGWMSVDENPQHVENSWNEREDDYSSVAFWYQTGQPTFAERAPENRRLPNIDRVIAYGRDNLDTHGEGKTEKQQLDIYDAPQLLYMPSSAQNAYVDIPFTVTRKEPLRLLLSMTTSYDFGAYQAYLTGPIGVNDTKVKLGGPLDFYSQEVDNHEFHLMDFWPEPGKYVLHLECVGKNQASHGYYCGLESVRLRERRPRVEQMGWDKDKDWHKNPILY
ncbi:MAG TPA: glycoside hydrolase family 172 protein, partial [Fimbriimonadaceae bacterium]|nr:glycoside hydrolase family 172 protein [Fimbriimonadaceae bacterium]